MVLLYERLSSSSALVPPIVCILLDAETRDAAERTLLEQKSGGKLRFLDRRMLENYVLDPEAIADVLTELGEPVTREIVADAIAAAGRCLKPPMNLADVDGAAILASVFSELSHARQEFRKTRDVPALVEYLVAHKPETLAQLRDCLRRTCGL